MALPTAINSVNPVFNALLISFSLSNPPTPIKATFPFISSWISFNLGVPAPSPLRHFGNNFLVKHEYIE